MTAPWPAIMRRYLLSIVVTALSAIPFLATVPYPKHVIADAMTTSYGRVEDQNKEVKEVDMMPTMASSIKDNIPQTSFVEMDHLSPIVVTESDSYSTAPISDHVSIMSAAGISPNDYAYVEFIVEKESSWRYDNRNPDSGAYGLCQALPASKMASSGSDYMTNPITQLKWCGKYAHERYGSWASAHSFWVANRWW